MIYSFKIDDNEKISIDLNQITSISYKEGVVLDVLEVYHYDNNILTLKSNNLKRLYDKLRNKWNDSAYVKMNKIIDDYNQKLDGLKSKIAKVDNLCSKFEKYLEQFERIDNEN